MCVFSPAAVWLWVIWIFPLMWALMDPFLMSSMSLTTFVIHIMRLIGVKHRKWNLALILFIGLANVGRPCPCIVALEVCTTFTLWFDGGWGYWTVTIFVLPYAIMWLYRCFLYRFKQIASYMWGFSINSHLFIFFHIGLLVVKTLLPHQTILIKPPYLTFRTYPSGLASI